MYSKDIDYSALQVVGMLPLLTKYSGYYTLDKHWWYVTISVGAPSITNLNKSTFKKISTVIFVLYERDTSQ